MTASPGPLERLSSRYGVALPCELTETSVGPGKLPRRPKRFLGVIDEVSVIGGQIELTSRAELEPEIVHLECAIDGATGVIRVTGQRSERDRLIIGFEFLETTPELEELIFATVAQAKRSSRPVSQAWDGSQRG